MVLLNSFTMQSLTMDPGKDNPFSQVACDSLLRPKKQQTLVPTVDQSTLGTAYQYQSGLSGSMSRQSMDRRTLFEDPAQVQQWVATTATGSIPDVDHSYPVLSGMSSEDSFCDTSATVSNFPGSNTVVHSDSFFSLSGNNGVYEQDFALENLANNFCASYLMDPVFSDDGHSAAEKVSFDGWTTAESQSYGLSTEMTHTVSSGSNQIVDKRYLEVQRMDGFSSPFYDGPIQHYVSVPNTTWSSPTTTSMEPSHASYSQDGQFPRQLGSPTSLTSFEDLSSNASNEDPALSPLSLGGPAQVPLPSTIYENLQFDAVRFVFPLSCVSLSNIPASSALRPADGFQGSPLSGLQYWPSCESVDHSQPMDIYMQRRHSNESDNANARRNQLYQLGPKEDNLYHCPFEISENCKHKPEKLKCNYE